MARTQPGSNVVPLPHRGERARSATRRRSHAANPRSGPKAAPNVILLPTARPAPLPPTKPVAVPTHPPGVVAAETAAKLCSAGAACIAYARLDSPAKLSRHNTTKIGNERYCYRCREEILAELSLSPDRRNDSEKAAAERWVARRLARTATRSGDRHRAAASAAPSHADSEATRK